MPDLNKKPAPSVKQLQNSLLRWFDAHQRPMPWRTVKGRQPDPYQVWLSEIMLQQTTVAAVGPYFETFIARWPRVQDLAAAELDDVLLAWAGLGYYARARNLHKCAQVICQDYGGVFPDNEDSLLRLPGIGPYTAAAVAAIAFDQLAVAVDGNVERVTARMFKIGTALPKAKKELTRRAQELGQGVRRPGDFVQAFMELGSTVCKPKNPACERCPWNAACQAYAADEAEVYPKRLPKGKKPQRYGTVYWVEDGKGRVLVRRRPEKGLLGGMIEFPSTEWVGKKPARAGKNQVRHSFTHFDLELQIREKGTKQQFPGSFWHKLEKLEELALPSLMQKVVRQKLA